MKYYGVIKKVTHVKNSWARIIVELDDKTQYVAVGKIIDPKEGFSVELEATKTIHPDWGEQLQVTECKLIECKSKAGIISFLTSGCVKGVGPALAEKIYDKFGDKVFEVIEKTPEKLLEIDGLKEKKMNSIIDSYKESNSFQNIYDFANGKITYNQVNKILKNYGKDALNVLNKNPYTLIYDIDGFGFKIVDKIALASGIGERSDCRIGAAIYYVLETLSQSQGHCFADEEMLIKEVMELINPIPEKVIEGIRFHNKFRQELFKAIDTWEETQNDFLDKSTWKLTDEKKEMVKNWANITIDIIDKFANNILEEVDANRLILDDVDAGLSRIYRKKLYDAECKVADLVSQLIKEKDPIKNIEETKILDGISISEENEGHELGIEQRNAVKMGLNNRLCIITGGPGRGKTTIIKTILDIWDDDESVFLCAPTGKASQRMKESTNRQAYTIHRIIKQIEPPSDSLVICDESSMLDIELASQLLSWACKHNNDIILVGDADQLSSVGPGNFFKDLIGSGCVPTTFLRTCYRNSGSIAINAERINNGKMFKSLIKDNHFQYVYAESNDVQKNILEQYDKLVKEYSDDEVVILSPSHSSTSGVDLLNTIIREKYNPYDPKNPRLDDVKFRLGDRVMQTKNKASKEVCKDGIWYTGVFNGDCGKITNVNLMDNTFEITFDDGRIANFDKTEMDTFVLCYAMTIHKSQGSEYKAVIVVCSTQHYIQLKRNLIYTAETRAKDKVVLIGQEKAVNIAIRNTDYEERNSRLQTRIRKLLSR